MSLTGGISSLLQFALILEVAKDAPSTYGHGSPSSSLKVQWRGEHRQRAAQLLRQMSGFPCVPSVDMSLDVLPMSSVSQAPVSHINRKCPLVERLECGLELCKMILILLNWARCDPDKFILRTLQIKHGAMQ